MLAAGYSRGVFVSAILAGARKNMKRFFAQFITAVVCAQAIATGFFIFATPAFAADDPYGLKYTANKTVFKDAVTQNKSLPQLVGDAISVLLSLIGLIFLVLAVYGGFRWMTAQGNKESVEKGRQILVDATIGVILIVSAYAITNFVFTDVIAPVTGASSAAGSETPTPDAASPASDAASQQQQQIQDKAVQDQQNGGLEPGSEIQA